MPVWRRQVDQTRGDCDRCLGPCRRRRPHGRPDHGALSGLSPGIARGEKWRPFGDTSTADLCLRHGRKRKPGGTLRRASRRPSLISPTVDFPDHARARSKANFIDPQFQHGYGMANTITGGDGLFLMPQNSPANILRTSGRAQPILSTVAQAVDRLCARRSLAGHLARRV